MSGWEPPLIQGQFQKYQWCTRGENCPLCNAMDGRVYTLEIYMASTVYPGFHPGCDCYLSHVPDDTPMSDIDIFGGAIISLLSDSWIDILSGHFDNLWMPGNTRFSREINALSKPGMTFKQAFDALKAQNNTGIFTDYGRVGNVAPGWNVWHNGTADVYQSFGDILTSISGLFPKVKRIRPYRPSQTYHNTIYNLGWER